jgi:hypothetical protein
MPRFDSTKACERYSHHDPTATSLLMNSMVQLVPGGQTPEGSPASESQGVLHVAAPVTWTHSRGAAQPEPAPLLTQKLALAGQGHELPCFPVSPPPLPEPPLLPPLAVELVDPPELLLP